MLKAFIDMWHGNMQEIEVAQFRKFTEKVGCCKIFSLFGEQEPQNCRPNEMQFKTTR